MTLRHNGGPLGDGWIARHRSVRDHWLVGHGIHVKPADPMRRRCNTQGEAWEDLLMECRYEAGTVNNGGRKMELRRGEMVGAVSWLGLRWNWTPKTVRRFLDQLENDGMIEMKKPGVELGTQKGKQANVVSICNYDIYQSGYIPEGQAKGQAEGKQGASKGQAEGNIYKDKQGNKGTIESTPNPQGGFALDGGKSRKAKAAFTVSEISETDEALQAWNETAERYGFVRVTVFPEKRRRRLLGRLCEIGGLTNFYLALAAIPQVPFLMGQVPPRSGESVFKFEFDHLMQTDGKLGDVLAKLIDKAHSTGVATVVEPWANWDEAEWVRQIAIHANGIWPVAKLSPPPGHEKTAVPPAIIKRERLVERYGADGISKEKH